jgi:hypothetical protein
VDLLSEITNAAGITAEGKPLPAKLDLLDAADFVAAPLEPPAELIQGVLHRGSKLVLGGGSKSFKTWTLLDLALSVAYGKPWLGFPTTPGRVLFLNFEIAPWSWQSRVQAVMQARGMAAEPGRLSLANLRGKAAAFRLLIPQIREAAGTDFALIVLDPVYKLYGGADENKAGDVAELLNALEELAVASGAAVAFGAHFSKGNQSQKESIDRISGSGVFARDPDSLLIFTRHEEQDAFTIDATLRNFPPTDPFVVRWQFPLMQRDANLDPGKLKKAPGGAPKRYSADDILEVLGDKSLSASDWQKLCENEIGAKSSSFYALLKELRESKRVIKSRISGGWIKACKP